MKNIYAVLLSVIGIVPAVLFSSCSEDVISIDLNDANPKIVIEAKVIEGVGPHSVSITKTTDYFEPSYYPPVTDATVSLSDSEGNEAILSETSPGFYQTSDIAGVVGRTYTLSVSGDGGIYTAISTMSPPAVIDSLVYEVYSDRQDEEIYIVNTYFSDTPNRDEYYRFKVYINGKPYIDLYNYQDRLTDGNEVHLELYIEASELDSPLEIGDVITIEMQSLDKPAYEYFSTLYDAATETAGSNFLFSAVPGNPISNISSDALGYFSAYTCTRDSVTVDTLKEK